MERSRVKIITDVANQIREQQKRDSSGHDWCHTQRVWNLGRRLSRQEGADIYVVELGCLTHDIADYKLNGGDKEIGPRKAGELLAQVGVDFEIAQHVQQIVRTMGFGGAANHKPMRTLEGGGVQDADFLDALGAIGIARCFAFGGSKGNAMHNPSIPPEINQSSSEYTKADHTQINHFYEKLLILEKYMNTATGKQLATKRTEYMKSFVERFLTEWDGEDLIV